MPDDPRRESYYPNIEAGYCECVDNQETMHLSVSQCNLDPPKSRSSKHLKFTQKKSTVQKFICVCGKVGKLIDRDKISFFLILHGIAA